MENNDKAPLRQKAEERFQMIMKNISTLEENLPELPEQFNYLSLEQKNYLFHEFERLTQNLNALTNWLSHPISHRARFKISSNVKVLVTHEEDSITLKFLEVPKNQN